LVLILASIPQFLYLCLNMAMLNKISRVNNSFTCKLILISFLFSLGTFLSSNLSAQSLLVRQPVDTVGFATTQRQMDSIIARIYREQGPLLRKSLKEAGVSRDDAWKTIISPHDDYSYVGYLYPALFQNLKAKTIILFGVAHKARQLGIENRIVFDSYPYWKTPFGRIPVSTVREEILRELPSGTYMVSDSLESLEHSVEALVPFIQYYRPDAEIVSVLVPAMNYDRAGEIAHLLAVAIQKAAGKRNWKWGTDFAIVISSDAVHYGDEGWGGSNYAFCGADAAGYLDAVKHEWEIIHTISGRFTPGGIRKFTSMTVDEKDFRIYKWTWCGRYSIPVGLLTSYYLSESLNMKPLAGTPVGYSTSIENKALPVKDLGMGVTAPANIHHWVGYPAIGYK
jgi:AmmeMemoRadiSam system protein B